MKNYCKPFMMKIVGLNYDDFFYQIKINGTWKQFKKSVDDFIHMMHIIFPNVMRESRKYTFEDKYKLANWLYNYGETIKPCETYVFYSLFD